MSTTGRRLRYAAAATAVILAFSSSAAFAAITVTSAKIEAGKLKVTGNSPTGTSVKLDNAFSANIVAGAFSFNISYLPSDCIAELTLVGAVAPAALAVIADCGPGGVKPMGNWNSGRTYVENDLVVSDGSSWRAKKNVVANLNKLPTTNPTFWEKFASKGATGLTGPIGAAGPAGANGAPGAAGPTGATGSQGPAGDMGPQGIAGPDGPQGPKGMNWRHLWNSGVTYAQGDAVSRNGASYFAMTPSTNSDPAAQPNPDWSLLAQKGDQGAAGAVGPQGAAGAVGPQGAAGATGPQGATGAQGAQGIQGIQGPQGATGATGAQGFQGPQGVAGPSGPKQFVAASPINLPPSGFDSYRFVTVPFVVPASVSSCLVTSAVQIQPATTAAPDTLYFRNAVARNNLVSEDNQYGHYFTNDGTGRKQPSVTRASVILVTPGQTVVFGVYFGGLAGTWYNAAVAVTTSYFCS
jgi:hypothetical protein